MEKIFDKNKGSSGMILLLFFSIIGATANSVLFKITLNSFSSSKTNYGFFVSQFSTFLYTFQALVVSLILMWRDPVSMSSLTVKNQSVYLYMGSLDAASATLGAIAGAYCPGGMQTILNQLIIPLTMIGAVMVLGTRFDRHQIWGSSFILLGSIVASSTYLFNSHGSSPDPSMSTDSPFMSLSASITLYFFSIIPCAMSNIYKERVMKELDMNEVHTSTVVSFWQLWIGFLFLPLLSLKSLGGLSYDEMSTQLQDGFQCFLGHNPKDPTANCSNASTILLIYIVINFLYNVNLLAITKRGSAVLLVMSQALSLPLTNIAFTLTSIMGSDAEPLTTQDLIGLLLTCIGFIAYSGLGFAQNFLVAQGPPGQMAYAHFEDHNEIIISPEIGTNPLNLIDLINGSLIRYQLRVHDQQDNSNGREGRREGIDEELQLTNERSQLIKSQEIRQISSTSLSLSSQEIQLKTLKILQQTVSALEQQISRERGEWTAAEGGAGEEEVIKEMILKYNQLFQGDLSSSSSSGDGGVGSYPSSVVELQRTYGT